MPNSPMPCGFEENLMDFDCGGAGGVAASWTTSPADFDPDPLLPILNNKEHVVVEAAGQSISLSRLCHVLAHFFILKRETVAVVAQKKRRIYTKSSR